MFSVPCLKHLCHFLSPVVFVVSLYLILFSLLPYSIYSPSVSLVLCELLSVMIVYLPSILFIDSLLLIVCSSFSMKCLYINPCLCIIFPQLLHNVAVVQVACLFDECIFESIFIISKILSTVKIRYSNTFTQVVLELMTCNL